MLSTIRSAPAAIVDGPRPERGDRHRRPVRRLAQAEPVDPLAGEQRPHVAVAAASATGCAAPVATVPRATTSLDVPSATCVRRPVGGDGRGGQRDLGRRAHGHRQRSEARLDLRSCGRRPPPPSPGRRAWPSRRSTPRRSRGGRPRPPRRDRPRSAGPATPRGPRSAARLRQ